MAKVGVILPLYNGEDYLARCLDSLLSQTMNDLEVLIIDDGSRDGSLKIAQQYAKDNPKSIKVLSQKNMGVANTRNKGIRLIASQYVIFIDQDDWIDADYCQYFYDKISGGNFDVVSGGYRRPDKYGKTRQQVLPSQVEHGKYILMAAWAKIHRTEFLRENNIQFYNNKFGEDIIFTVKEIMSTRKWKQTNYVGYNWFFNEMSVSNTSQKGLNPADHKLLLDLLQNLLDVFDDDRQQDAQYYLLRTIVYCLLSFGRQAKPDDFVEIYNLMFDWLDEHTSSFGKNGYLPFGPKGEILSVRVAVFGFVLIRRLRMVKLFAKVYCRG